MYSAGHGLQVLEVPQYLLENGLAGKGMIAVTQPRRVAATSLADRVSKEQGVPVGDTVGYAVRFDEKHTSGTRIKYMTDGMIVRELMSDPLLSKYSVVVVDEAHERTLRTDLLIANLKTIQKKRNNILDPKGKGNADKMNPLKVIIMSATLDAEKFSKFFHKSVSFSVFVQEMLMRISVLRLSMSRDGSIPSLHTTRVKAK